MKLRISSAASRQDIERLLFVTMLFNFDPGVAFFQDVVSDLRSERRAEERQKYPKCVMSCLMYLAYHRVYPAELIASVVSPEFVASINGESCWGREI